MKYRLFKQGYGDGERMAERWSGGQSLGWIRLLDSRLDPASTSQSVFASPASSGPQFPHLKGVGLGPFAYPQ